MVKIDDEKYMREPKRILGGKACLYLIPHYRDPSQNSKNWQCVFYLKDGDKPVKRKKESMKTSNIAIAEENALKRYGDLMAKFAKGETLSVFSFDRVCREFLEQQEKRLFDGTKGVSKKYIAQTKMAINKFLAYEPFRGVKIDEFNDHMIVIFFNTRQKSGRYSFNTHTREALFLRQVFEYAYKQGYINQYQIPTVKRPYKEKGKRAKIKQNQWDTILKKVIEMAFNDKDKRNYRVSPLKYYIRVMSYYYIMTLAYSGVRPGNESRYMKWSDIQFQKLEDDDDKTNELMTFEEMLKLIDFSRLKGDINQLTERCDIMPVITVRSEHAKKREQRISFCSSRLTYVLCHWYFLEMRNRETEYVFTDYYGKPIVGEISLFRQVLRELDRTKADDRTDWCVEIVGNKKQRRTLYSLRHMSITNAIQKNVETSAIETSWGTSYPMLIHHYKDIFDLRTSKEVRKIDF